MKAIMLMIWGLFIFTVQVFSQSEYEEEFNIKIVNPDQQSGYPVVVIKAFGNLYLPDPYSPNATFYPTTEYGYAYKINTTPPYNTFELRLEIYPGGEQQNFPEVVWGKYKIIIGETTSSEPNPATGEVFIDFPRDSFYLDLSTTNYPWSYGGGEDENGDPDMFFDYDWENQTLSVKAGSNSSVDADLGTTIAVWDNYYNPGAPAQVYSNFYVAPPAHFALGVDPSGQHCPKLTWVPESFPIDYKIYRKVNNGSFSLYSTLSNSTAGQFIDYELAQAGSGSNTVYYYLTATNVSYTSNPTDTLNINWLYEGYGKNLSTGIIPVDFQLDQNYPNPFNPATTIHYRLPEKISAALTVYNLLGQKVRTLVNENKEAGYYSVVWDGKDEKGQYLPSGVYLYRMRAGDFVQTKRMTLLK